MIAADEIYNILEDIKQLQQKRNYTKDRFFSIRKKMQPLVDNYHWHQDEFLSLAEEKDSLFDYNIVKKEIKALKSLLNYINKLLKKKEFSDALAASNVNIEEFEKAIKFNKLKLIVLKDRNKECRRAMKRLIKVIRKSADQKDFLKALAEWDDAQAKVAYVDRLENALEKKVIIEQARKYPESVRQSMGMWELATAYAVAAMIGFGIVTGNYTLEKGFSFGSALAGEVQKKSAECIRFVTYYNHLDKAGIDWKQSGLDLVIIAHDDERQIKKIRNAGVKVYMYFPCGSDYGKAAHLNQNAEWEAKVKKFVDDHPYVDGFFWDEMNPRYFGYSKLPDFNKRLTDINHYIQSKGQKTIANGVMYYADHCDSDYYMWESFMSTFAGNERIPRYDYVDFFQKTWGNDPYDWKNGITTWKYLKNRGVLGKTLAHSYGNPKDDEKSVYGRIAARVLGVGGFSYADANNFATRKLTLAKGMKMDLGPGISAQIDKKNKILSGVFEKGAVNCMAGQTFDSKVTKYSINRGK